MYCELTCKCEAHLQLDTEQEDAAWLMVHRFAEAHTECGFVVRATQPDGPPRRRVVYRDNREKGTDTG